MPSLYSPMDEAIGHWRRYDKIGLTQVISGAGLEVVRIWSFNASTRPRSPRGGGTVACSNAGRLPKSRSLCITASFRPCARSIGWRGCSAGYPYFQLLGGRLVKSRHNLPFSAFRR